MHPEFLTHDDVLLIHKDQIVRYGGSPELRDSGLLSSAVEQPKWMYDGEFLHTDLIQMAAAYLYHIVLNHPFEDGNKRTGTTCALVFLDLNGVQIGIPEDELAEFVLEVAQGNRSKDEVAKFFFQFLL